MILTHGHLALGPRPEAEPDVRYAKRMDRVDVGS